MGGGAFAERSDGLTKVTERRKGRHIAESESSSGGGGVITSITIDQLDGYEGYCGNTESVFNKSY